MNKMPVNQKEQVVYTVLMVLFMALAMTSYNVILHHGLSVESLKIAWLMFPITFVTAFLCEWFIVGPLAMKFSRKILKQEDAILKKVCITAFFFVTGMVLLMSFLGPLISNGPSPDFVQMWMRSIPINFAMAYPLQIVIAGPFIGFIFRKMFPIGTLVDVRANTN